MYSRSFQPPKEGKYGDIPVQSFEDSFSADAFLKESGAAQKTLPERSERTDGEREKDAVQSGEPSAGKTPQALRPDDLLLLILLLVFLADARKSGDKILPLLFAALLLS